MNTKSILAILTASIWISLSEFTRNELLFKNLWINHYQDLGLIFPSDPINGAMWGVWSLLFAIGIFTVSRKFTLIETTFIAWWMGFVLMWMVIGNMNVLPFPLLVYAIPLSILEAWLASWIIHRISK